MFYHDNYRNGYTTGNNQTISASNGDIYLYKCYYSYLTEGVFHFFDSEFRFLHSYCEFFTMGSTYFQKTAIIIFGNSSIIQHRYIAVNCITRYNFAFSYTRPSSETLPNYAIEGSVSLCDDCAYTDYREHGEIISTSMNYSSNRAGDISCVGYQSDNEFGVTNFSLFENNIALPEWSQGPPCCIGSSGAAKFALMNSNLINNTNTDPTGGTTIF